MYLRLTIVVITCALTASAVYAQNKPQLTVDELVAKNVAAKGGADALRALRSVRLTGKLLVNEGQIQLAYLETKKRPGAIRDESHNGLRYTHRFNSLAAGGQSVKHAEHDCPGLSAGDA